ncbi:MAG: hypothetical protein Q9184_005320 [Pyrenodesmia sp. 2 TL-2023]
MPTPKRQSHRAAIKEWLAHTEEGAAEGKQSTTTQNKERTVEKGRRRSPQRAAGETRQPRGGAGELHQNLDSQIYAPSEEGPRDPQTKQDSGRNLADQLGLHAPFRSFATRGVDAEPEPARLDQERRKRRRTPSSTSSYLEPAIYFRKEKERPIGQEDAWVRKGNHHQQRASTDASSTSSNAIAPPEKPAKTYERKPRHKTREDRYDLKQDNKRSRTRKGHNKVEKHPNKKRKKRKEKSGAALMHDFSARNIESERLTVRPYDMLIHSVSRATVDSCCSSKHRSHSDFLGKDGRHHQSGAEAVSASTLFISAVCANKTCYAVPDLTFSEINFLNHHKKAPKDNPPPGKPSRRNRDKAADADAEISRFFATSNSRTHKPEDTRSQKKESEDRQGIAPEKMQRQDRSSIPPVDLPERPFLGFGGVGPGHVLSNAHENDLNKRAPLCQTPSSGSTTYFTWSQTNVSRRSSPRHASQPCVPFSRDLGLLPISESPVQGGVRTSSTSVDHNFREESRTPSSKPHHKVHCTSTGRNTSDPALTYERSKWRGQTNVNAEECSKRQNKSQEIEHQESQQSHDVGSPKADLASLLAAHDRPELLGAVLDALLGRATNNLSRKKEGERPSETSCSKSVDPVRVSETVPEAQTSQDTGHAASQGELPLDLTTADESEVAAKLHPAPGPHQSQPLDDTTKQSTTRMLPNASRLQSPFSDAHGSRRLGKEQDRQHPNNDNHPLIQIPRVAPYSTTAWTGYRNLYQCQIGVKDRDHDDNIETITEGAYGDYSHLFGTRSEPHLSGAADHLDRYHMFDEYQKLDAYLNRQHPSAEGTIACNHAEPQLYDRIDAVDQQIQEEALDDHHDEQDARYLEDTRPFTEHARHFTAEQDLHSGVETSDETSDSLATPTFFGAGALTMSDRNENLSPWSLRRHQATRATFGGNKNVYVTSLTPLKL